MQSRTYNPKRTLPRPSPPILASYQPSSVNDTHGGHGPTTAITARQRHSARALDERALDAVLAVGLHGVGRAEFRIGLFVAERARVAHVDLAIVVHHDRLLVHRDAGLSFRRMVRRWI